jgi:hypothetical protein
LKEYFQDSEEWRERQSRTLSFSLQLANTGRVPAESISIMLFIRANADLETDYTKPNPPNEPKPPQPPAEYDGLVIISASKFRPKYQRGFTPSEAEKTANISSSLGIGKTAFDPLWGPTMNVVPGKGAGFSQQFPKIQQATSESVGPIHVVFRDSVKSFRIDFLLRADHMEPKHGELNVVVK